MRFTDIDINFDIRYEGHQNCLKILSMNILSVFSDHHLWRQNWHQYLWTSLCQFNFFVNLLHSLGVSFFDIWHLFDNLTSFWYFGSKSPMGPLSPCGSYPSTPLPMYPIAHMAHTPCIPYPMCPYCPCAPYPCTLYPQWASLPICPIPLYPIAHVTHCLCGPYPLCPIAHRPHTPVPIAHTPCAPYPLWPYCLSVPIAHVNHTPCAPLPIGPMAHVAYTPCTP